MIKIWQCKSVNAAKATWPKRMQSVCKAYGTCMALLFVNFD